MHRTIAGLLAGLFACLSFAQEDAVVVTATRFRDSKRDLPVGVTVVTADELRRSASADLAEVLARFGLVHVRDNAGTPNQQLDLRGFGITGDQNTLVLVDGVRISENELAPAQIASIPLESIERIEILRGSGAVLYGDGASGGTVNIITRRAQPGAARGYALGRAGGYGTAELRGGYARMGERFGFSVDASQQDTDGYRGNNRYRQTNLAGTLEARGEGSRGYLRLALADQSLGLPGALTEAQIAADPRQASTPGNRAQRQDATLTLGGSASIGRHDLAADLSYRQKNAEALFLPAFFTDTRVGVWSFLPRAKLRFDALGRTQEVVLGVDWERWNYDNRNATDPATIGSPFSRRTGDQTTLALYAQGNLWLAERTRFVLGARGQRTEQRLAELVFPTDDRRATRRLDAYEGALRQGLGGGFTAYAKHGTSFRLANFDENACFFPPCAPTLLEPQKARTSELGLDYEHGGLRGRAAIYETRLKNEIYFSPLLFSNINLSPTRRRGVELEGAWRATRELELRAALALMEATFVSGTYAGVDVSGKRVPLVPRAIASGGLSWFATPRTRLNVDARYVGTQRYDNDQANAFVRQMPAYALVDMKLEHRIERVSLALEARNLFDKKYYSYGIWDGATSFSAYPQPGRAVYLSAAYRTD